MMDDETFDMSEEERAEKVAEALTARGLSAFAQDTGGGIVCIIVERKEGGEIAWGTADVTWSAVITDEDGEQISCLETQWPSDAEDIEATAHALFEPSVRNGATLAEA
jgi:predicted amidohydrolase